MELSRFRSGVLRAILAIKGSNLGLGRIWQRHTSREFKRDAALTTGAFNGLLPEASAPPRFQGVPSRG